MRSLCNELARCLGFGFGLGWEGSLGAWLRHDIFGDWRVVYGSVCELRLLGELDLARHAKRHLGAPAGGLDLYDAARSLGLPLDELFGLGAGDADLAQSPRWRASASGSLSSAHSSGGDLTSVRCTSEEIIA